MARRWRRRPVRNSLLLGVPLTLLIVVGIVLGPVVYQGTRAYQDIFVDRVPHQTDPLFPGAGSDATPGGGDQDVASEEGGATGGAVVVDPLADLPIWDGTEPLTLLLLGVDRRENEPSRTDTMILVWVDPVAKQASMLSIPRDLKVIVPGYGVHKINAAYAIGDAADVPGGGPALTIQTIEANFGIRVDHFAQVDFQGFVALVDLLGGVTIDVPYPIKDDAYPAPNNQYTRVYFPAGWQHMDGARALQYARTRHADGDVQRAVRQQQVLLALREKTSLMDLLPQAGEILATLGDSVRTDLSPDQAIRLARLATEIPRDAIDQFTLMNSVSVEDPEGIFWLVPDWDAVGDVLSQFTRTSVEPPPAALARVDYDIPIRVENGTNNQGLAARVAEQLEAYGFTNVTFAPATVPGYYPSTTVIDHSGNLTTAALAAAVIGVDAAIIEEQFTGTGLLPPPTPTAAASQAASPAVGSPSPVASPTPGATASPATTPSAQTGSVPPSEAEQVGIVIVLGEDAPDPAWYVEPGA
jgi:polyisoprenyl-teichoic acid--peptidoglycan teichoic acid transferase